MTIREAIEKTKLEFKRIKYFKNECSACVEDEVIEAIEMVEKELDSLVKIKEEHQEYEKALETISWTMNPAIIIQNERYYLTIQGGDLIAVLPKEEGENLFELFGGSNHDSN